MAIREAIDRFQPLHVVCGHNLVNEVNETEEYEVPIDYDDRWSSECSLFSRLTTTSEIDRLT